jgi:glycosyltransferase involved in cell wall biosynthesis
VPANDEVDLSLSDRLRSRRQRIGAAARRPKGLRLVGSEARRARAPRRHPQALAHLLTAAGTAVEVERWCAGRRLPPSTVALTVWLGAAAVGTTAAGITTISRAHGGDLYEQRAPHGYLPLQRRAIDGCVLVASVSDAGAAHLRRRYPSCSDRIGVRRLGVAGASHVGAASSDGWLRVVSCSSLVSVKRPELLVDAVRALTDRHDQVEWHHFGSGPLRAEFEERVRSTLGRARVVLPGAVANQAILDHYQSQPVDVFLNTSASEGLPVSMMEAASAGVPIVAPDVGGIPEIVDEATGRLFPLDSDPGSIAGAILAEAARNDTARRHAIRERWRERFSADRNYPAFAAELAAWATRGPR